MAPYLVGTEMHKILDIVDVDSEKWRAYAAASNWPMRAIYTREATMLLSLERKLASAFDASVFVSEAEKRVFLSLAPEAVDHTLAMNNGVDTEYFDPALPFSSPFERDQKVIVFTGTMNYRPNIDAVTHFARDILPTIRARYGEAIFWIVGALPTRAVRGLACDHIRVTGQVGDMRPYLAHAHCVVAPLKIARGVQNKVLEAMAMARPVVATPEAREGTDTVPGENIIIAESAHSFAQAVISVLENHPRQLAERARSYVTSHHSWKKNLQLLDTLFPV
jgi:sugar transferase (PEP-CTERM/EpsH1 system associated)